MVYVAVQGTGFRVRRSREHWLGGEGTVGVRLSISETYLLRLGLKFRLGLRLR